MSHTERCIYFGSAFAAMFGIVVKAISLTGCGTAQEFPLLDTDGVEVQRADQLPPRFGLGDKVSPNGSDRIGIVVQQTQNNKSFLWRYTVMFNNWRFDYDADEINLVERMDWDKRIEPEIKAEVESDVPFDILEGEQE